jgi:hypothetical protein
MISTRWAKGYSLDELNGAQQKFGLVFPQTSSLSSVTGGRWMDTIGPMKSLSGARWIGLSKAFFSMLNTTVSGGRSGAKGLQVQTPARMFCGPSFHARRN